MIGLGQSLLLATVSCALPFARVPQVPEVRSGQPEPNAADEARIVALPAELAALLEEVRSARVAGDLDGARVLLEEAFERGVHERLLAEAEEVVLAGLTALEREARAADHLSLLEKVRHEKVERLSARLHGDHPELLAAMQALGTTKWALGDLAGAHELFEAVHGARARLLPSGHLDLLAAKQNLALTRVARGDLAGALELEEAVLEARTRLLPPEDPDVLASKLNLAATRFDLGDLEGAHVLLEDVNEVWTRLLPSDHPDLLKAKQNLAVTREALGDIEGAHVLLEAVHEVCAGRFPPDHPDLLRVKLNLAGARTALGDLAGARALEESVVEAWSRLLPPDHPDLLGAKQNLAVTLHELGDLAGAEELQESVLEARERLLPSDHPDLVLTKQNHAVLLKELGDLAGAQELEREAVAVWTRILDPDHPTLLVAKQNLAATCRISGDFAAALELETAVLETRSRLLHPDHPELLASKQGLALAKRALGDLEGAQELEEAVLEARARLLPPDHPDLLQVKQNLAVTKKARGDLEGARVLEESVLEAWTHMLPADHPDRLGATQNLSGTRYDLGDTAGARRLATSLLAGVRLRARALHAEAPRAARQGAAAELHRIEAALYLNAARAPEEALEREIFSALEALRLASVASSEAAHALATRPELAEKARRVEASRARLSDLTSSAPEEGESPEGWRQRILALAQERDRGEKELRGALTAAGVFESEVEATGVAARLPSDGAVVSYLRFKRWFEGGPEPGAVRRSLDSLLAFVVVGGGKLERVELGSMAELEALVASWRAALGRPLDARGRGVGAEASSPAEDLEASGARLRARILDPVLAVAPGARRVHVVLDDILHLVPLDALPLEEGLVGDRTAIRYEVSLARLLRSDAEVDPGGTLTVAGGVDYDAELASDALGRLEASSPPLAGPSERFGGALSSFERLPGTIAEAEAIAALYAHVFERKATVLSGARATKGALLAAAPKTRFLHLATHGWFASESFKSQLDSLAEQGARDSWRRAEETLTGFAPETLCGLALAGANRGKDALRRVPGILTAEELASFDLRNCELAVLSACETNVGIRRAGQGIQSLQTALHAAGARTAITSLWKVDDAATRRLFELFYTKLWKDKLGKSAALWQAKMALRAEGHPPHDWAGWVLSGDPE